jgi:integrase
MAKKRLLTYRKADGRYMKIIDGRAYYFGRGNGPGDTKSYREAEQRYLEFIARRAVSAPAVVSMREATVADVAEKYLQHMVERYERGEISASYCERTKCAVNDFVAGIGGQRRFTEVDELRLEDYKSATLRRPASRRTGRAISPATAKGRLDAVKVLYRWAYLHRLIDDQPRNLLNYTRFSLPQPKVAVFSLNEVRALWAAAPETVRTYIALGLNCGYGQTDIAELRLEQIDFDHGVIERERTKTGIPSRHALWPVTIELLGRHVNEGAPGDRALLSQIGQPLVTSAFVDGKLRHNDAIKCAFWRVLRHVGINGGRGFYSLRKTAATEIERINPLVTSLFLAHSPREMKRFYALPHWDALDQALRQLGERFDLRL